MNDDGTMARVPQLTEFCRQHDMKILTVAELIRYRMANERYVKRLAESLVPTAYGEFRMIAYESEITGDSHIALVKGDVENAGNESVLVRMHAHCLVGDVFGANWCGCRDAIEGSLRRIAEEGRGALIYLHSTSKGYSVERLGEQLTIQFHHEQRLPTLPESQRRTQREIGIGARDFFSDLNLKRIRLLTNHPRKVAGLEGFGIEIVEQIPVSVTGKAANTVTTVSSSRVSGFRSKSNPQSRLGKLQATRPQSRGLALKIQAPLAKRRTRNSKPETRNCFPTRPPRRSGRDAPSTPRRSLPSTGSASGRPPRCRLTLSRLAGQLQRVVLVLRVGVNPFADDGFALVSIRARSIALAPQRT